MTNPVRKHKKKEDEIRKTRREQLLKQFGSFVVGTIFVTLFGLYVVSWFVALLPGPTVAARVHGLKVKSGEAAGCTVYDLEIMTKEPVDYAYLKVQFTSKITDAQFGFPQEAETPVAGRVFTQLWEVYRDPTGRCAIRQTVFNITTDIQVSFAGNMFTTSITKLASQSTVTGLVVTAEGESTINPPPEMYMEGAYEYSKLGQIVRKSLHIENLGFDEAK